ncbi:Uncharacterised protein [Mycobacteroides abscessus subsp. abscessus]|nr:Uncharacterised protein [Mycobacteroides abscessus subsp. abscessus]
MSTMFPWRAGTASNWTASYLPGAFRPNGWLVRRSPCGSCLIPVIL